MTSPQRCARPQHVTKGIMLMTAAQIFFVAVWGSIKYLGTSLPLFELLLFRSLFSLIILAPMVHLRIGSFRARNIQTLFFRSLFGYLAMIMSFYAFTKIEFGNATTLLNTIPIFVALLAPLFLREAFVKKQFVLIAAAFIGMLMILKPNGNILAGASIYGLMAGFFAALAMMGLRKLGETDSSLIVAFYFTAFATVASAPVALINFKMPLPHEWFLLVFTGAAVTAAQLAMTKAYKLANAATIAPFGYVSVIGSYIAGVLVFGEVPDVVSAAGAFVIVACGVGIMLTARRGEKMETCT